MVAGLEILAVPTCKPVGAMPALVVAAWRTPAEVVSEAHVCVAVLSTAVSAQWHVSQICIIVHVCNCIIMSSGCSGHVWVAIGIWHHGNLSASCCCCWSHERLLLRTGKTHGAAWVTTHDDTVANMYSDADLTDVPLADTATDRTATQTRASLATSVSGC